MGLDGKQVRQVIDMAKAYMGSATPADAYGDKYDTAWQITYVVGKAENGEGITNKEMEAFGEAVEHFVDIVVGEYKDSGAVDFEDSDTEGIIDLDDSILDEELEQQRKEEEEKDDDTGTQNEETEDEELAGSDDEGSDEGDEPEEEDDTTQQPETGTDAGTPTPDGDDDSVGTRPHFAGGDEPPDHESIPDARVAPRFTGDTGRQEPWDRSDETGVHRRFGGAPEPTPAWEKIGPKFRPLLGQKVSLQTAAEVLAGLRTTRGNL